MSTIFAAAGNAQPFDRTGPESVFCGPVGQAALPGKVGAPRRTLEFCAAGQTDKRAITYSFWPRRGPTGRHYGTSRRLMGCNRVIQSGPAKPKPGPHAQISPAFTCIIILVISSRLGQFRSTHFACWADSDFRPVSLQRAASRT